MANVHTFGSFGRGGSPTGYRPFGVSQNNPSTGSTPIIRFGHMNADGSVNDVGCLRAFFPHFEFKSFTCIITIIQVLVFAITKIYSYIQGDHSFDCILYKSGAAFTPAIVVFHHLHRLILPIFLHGGYAHIFFNMLGQWFYSFRLEKTYGTKKFAILYLLSGLGGNLLSSALKTNNISVGASSSLFGVFAFYFAYLIEDPDQLGPRRNLSILFMLFMLFSNVANASKQANIDNHAHLGGFITGALIAINLIQWPSDPKFGVKQKVALGLVILFHLGCFIYIESYKNLENAAYGVQQRCQQMLGW